MIRRYGHKAPRIPHVYLLRQRYTLGAAALPDVVDQTPLFPTIVDQGSAGSCTGCSGAGALDALSQREINDGVWSGPPLRASELGLYYLERQRDGTTAQDAGASIADAVAVASSVGVIPAADWPYDANNVLVPPPASALADAGKVKLVDAAPLDHDEDTLRACLAQGFPVQIGVQVFASFESDAAAATGDVPQPDPAAEQLLGGHAIVLVGYDHNRRVFYFRNSWGTGWGAGGYGTLPYAYVLDGDLCTELYVYRRLAQSP